MSRLLYILIAILMLGFITIVHELGHFLLARLLRIGVSEFSVGFGPKLFGFERKGIAYSLRALPLGGYCKFIGEDESSNAANALSKQRVWKRVLTVLAGPVMNLILAFLFCVILLWGFLAADYVPQIAVIYPDTAAAESTMLEGDIVIAVNGHEVSQDSAGIETIRSEITASGYENSVELTLKRNEETHIVSITPEKQLNEATGETSYMLGIAFGTRGFTLSEAFSHGASYMVNVTGQMLTSLKNLVFRGEGADDFVGPVGIISLVSTQISNDTLYAIVNLIFIISLNLGIINLLPLPALDGGRLCFLALEGIRRKPVPPEKEGMVHAGGMLLLLAVIVFFTYKDIVRLFTN